MTTHPTSVDAGLTARKRTVREAGHVPDLRSGSRISEQRVAMTVDSLAALVTAQPSPQIGENQMKRRQFQQLPDQYGSGAARTPWLLHRLRDAAFARRSAHRKAEAAVDIVPAIENQLHALQPICSAQRVSTGTVCGAVAVAVAEMHAVDGCDQMGLSPDGDLVETLCQACLATVQWAMATYVGDKREMASRSGTRPMCSTCGRPTGYLRSVFAVRPIGHKGPAS